MAGKVSVNRMLVTKNPSLISCPRLEANTASNAIPTRNALERPGLDEGPHLSYAIQWFTFSAIAAGGYLLILRRIARTRAGLRPAESPVPDGRPEAPTPAAT